MPSTYWTRLFIVRNSITLIVSRLCGCGYAVGSSKRELDGSAFCDRDQAGLPMHRHHKVEWPIQRLCNVRTRFWRLLPLEKNHEEVAPKVEFCSQENEMDY